ncbi:MAG: DUF202 domain-containing protein [Chloroflexi bacterium]|nr:DUF202 domain-containing protein [Chloroflexota bacterium]
MAYNPYSRFATEELILRDHLAMDRTILANERTFLAYVRTGLGLLAAGASFLHFFDAVPIHLIGWLLVLSGVTTFLIGFVRYRKMDRLIHAVRWPDQPDLGG